MLKPATDLERYLAGEFASEQDFWIPRDDAREAKSSKEMGLCLLKRVLTPFLEKGS
jgi:hypothetical protein